MVRIDLRAIILAALRRKWLVIYSVLALTAVGTVLAFTLPRRYTASATILPPLEESTTGSSMLSMLSKEIGISNLSAQGMTTASLDLFVAILRSRTVLERVAAADGVTAVLGQGRKLEAIERLVEATEIGFTKEEVAVQISVTLRRPALAALVANQYVAELDRFLKETNMTRGRNTRLFIEGRLNQARQDLARAEDSLRVFQLRSGTIVLDPETEESIRYYAQLKAQAVAKEVALNIIRDYATPDNPLYINARRELTELQRELSRIERRLPGVAEEYIRRVRDVKIQEQINALLIEQYEQARILEARDTPVVVVLEHATTPVAPSWPKKKLLIGLFAVLGLLVGSGLVWGAEYFDRLRRQPGEFEAWQEFGRSVRASLRLRPGSDAGRHRRARS